MTFSYLCFNDYVFVKDLTVSEQIYVEIVKILYQLLEFSTKTDMTVFPPPLRRESLSCYTSYRAC